MIPFLNSRFLYIAGADGTGKTTLANEVVKQLRAQGIPCKQLWLRFPLFWSLPLLAYARLRHFSRAEVVNGTRYGYWDFGPSWVMSTVFPWLALFDAFILSRVQIGLPLLLGQTLVCERFVLDLVIDLAVGLDDPEFWQQAPGKYFLSLIPGQTHVVILDLDLETIVKRRPSLADDRSLARKREFYLKLAADGRISVWQADDDVGNLAKAVLQSSADISQASPPYPYYRLKTPLPKGLLRRPAFALFVHWTFQSILYMDVTERIFKVGLDILLFLMLAPLLALIMPLGFAILAALVTAHTLNFLCNAHPWVVLKHFHFLRHTRHYFKAEIDRLSTRALLEPSIAYAAVYGSTVRGELKEISDLDVRLVRKPGIQNGIRACWFTMCERTRAFVTGFPLDIYVFDGKESLGKMNHSEEGLILHDAF